MNPLLFILLILIFVVAPLTLLGLCLVGRGDPKAPSPFLANGFATSPLETEGRGASEGASSCSPESSFGGGGGVEGHAALNDSDTLGQVAISSSLWNEAPATHRRGSVSMQAAGVEPGPPSTNPFLPNSRPMEDWERKDSDEFIASHFRGGIEGHSLDAVERPEPPRTISMQDRINNTTL